jgi:hypothetical protein
MKYLLLALLLGGCVSQQKLMDSWIGSTKQDLILKWGPPEREVSDGGSGEILVYSRSFFNPNANLTQYVYRMMYVDREGKIYHWLTQTGLVPPELFIVTIH